MRWDLLVEGLRRHFQKLRRVERATAAIAGENGLSSSSDDEVAEEETFDLVALLREPLSLLYKCVCARVGGRLKIECLEGRCAACGNFKKLQELFAGSGLLPEGPLLGEGKDIEDEDAEDENIDSGLAADEDDVEETPPNDGGGDTTDHIVYDKWEGRLLTITDGTVKKKFDFIEVNVPLREYWSDLLSFFRPFLLHDDLNSDCRAAWSSLQANFRRGRLR